MSETGTREDPWRGFNFRVEIERAPVAGFRECTGLSATVEVTEYREGNDIELHPRKLTALRRFANIVLRRGFTTDQSLYNWYRALLVGTEDRRDGAIVLMDERREDVMRWKFTNGWITRWAGPAFNATANDVLIEELELAVERVEAEWE
jgi:phage tail-like protein